jgi:hypothetical protein
MAYNFFPVKVIKVLSKDNKDVKSDNTIQAFVEAATGMKSICAVHPDIQNKIKEGDIALVDWSLFLIGSNPLNFTPKALIIKIVEGETKNILAEAFEKAKSEVEVMKKIKERESDRYIG